MSILPIVTYDHPALRISADPVPENHERLPELIENMFETMHQAGGVGLAAPQVGVSIRLFVVDADAMTEEEEGTSYGQGVFINPEISPVDDEEWDAEEGCLSLPDVREIVTRPYQIKIRYYDREFRLRDEEYEGWYARVLQHEFDHLNGKLFIDYLGPFRKRLLKTKLQDIIDGNVETDYLLAPKKAEH